MIYELLGKKEEAFTFYESALHECEKLINKGNNSSHKNNKIDMIEKPANGRATIGQSFNSLNISIPSKKKWFVILFMMVWMIGWFFGEIFAITKIFGSDTPLFANAFLLVWLTGWTLGGLFALYTISWLLFGQELISAENGLLTIQRSIKGIGRKKVYDIKSIKNIDMNLAAYTVGRGSHT